jgi:hypothetical protein
MVGVVILRITSFVAIIIVGFDPIIDEVGDLVISMRHLGFCIQVVMWLKTRV